MIPYSVKFKGHRCFKNDWAGFDRFQPINVIVGRNNTGKSQLLDLVEMLTTNGFRTGRETFQFRAKLTEGFLKTAFPENAAGGVLGGSSHWRHGQELIGSEITWEWSESGVRLYPADRFKSTADGGSRIESARHTVIEQNLVAIKSGFSGMRFRRIMADRDIRPEKTKGELSLSADGNGATHIMQRFITNELLDAELIQEHLRVSLNEIFGPDGNFTRLVIQQKGKFDASEENSPWEVFLHEPTKGLVPLSRSGSGLKTIILVLLNLLVIPVIEKQPESQYVFAFEELENNLHPSLLRRLLHYLSDFITRSGGVLFLTTHSNVTLDFFGILEDAQIIQVSHDGDSASTRTVMTHFDRLGSITDLGGRPSDLLQANGILWLEGPSDRIYFNRFIDIVSGGTLKEGRDYQCAYYGGSVLAKAAFSAPEDADKELVNLLRLNNNIAVVCDGDRVAEVGDGAELKGRVRRIAQEVAAVPNHFVWVTESKEIENYIPGCVWSAVYDIPDIPDPGRFDKFPTGSLGDDCFVAKNCRRTSFDKCEFAAKATPMLTVELLSRNRELTLRIQELVDTIKKWNR